MEIRSKEPLEKDKFKELPSILSFYDFITFTKNEGKMQTEKINIYCLTYFFLSKTEKKVFALSVPSFAVLSEIP